jgi:arginyl-tRNA synthetase
VFYLNELAQSFQSYYTQTKKEKDTILPLPSETAVEGWQERWDWDQTRGRLLWVDAIKTVYRSGLELLGLEAPERMSRATPVEEGDAEE